MSRKKANLRDVAAMAGVSVATVSRVMNSPAQVSPQTRARVEAVMVDLHFTPSAAARAINSGRSRTVAALLPTLDNATFSRFVASLESRLGHFGLSLVVATTGEDPILELTKARQMVDIGVDAIVVSGISQSVAFRDYISRANLPAVAISLFDETAWLPTIGYDNHSTVSAALDHLVTLGHRDIAVVHGPSATNDRTRSRLDALGASLKVSPVPLSFSYFETTLSLEGGAEAASILIEAQGFATAVLAFADVLAVGAMNFLHRKGYKVPHDVSVIGMEDLPSSAHSFPPLTTVHLPVQRMGIQVAEALAKWLDHDEKPGHHLLPFELTIRESTSVVEPS